MTSAPEVVLSQAPNFSTSVPMSALGPNQYAGTAKIRGDSSGNLEISVSSGGETSESINPFVFYGTDEEIPSGYYAPNGNLEMRTMADSFSGSGSFVITNSTGPIPTNGDLVQVGNVWSFGFSDSKVCY